MNWAEVKSRIVIDRLFTSKEKDLLMDYVEAMFTTSKGREIIEKWLDESDSRVIEFEYKSKSAQGSLNGGKVFYDFEVFGTSAGIAYSGDLVIDPNGIAVRGTHKAIIIHELGHALTGAVDSDWVDPQSAFDGSDVRLVNPILKDLKISQRLSYSGVDANGFLSAGRDYSDGGSIKRAWVESASGLGIDPINFTSAQEYRSVNANDLLIGGDSKNTLYGGEGNDLLYGQGNIDVLYGDGGADKIFGGEGADTIYGDDGADELYGHEKYDGGEIVKDDNAVDNIRGGEGEDSIYGGGGGDSLYGDGDNDVIYGHTKDGKNDDNAVDTIRGGAGDDKIYGGGGGDSLFGGDDADEIYGHTKDGKNDDNAVDYINGEGGEDHIYGGGGNDLLNGGGDADYLYGEAGDDKIYGHTDFGSDDDNAVDYIRGGVGNDKIYGGGGGDTLGGDDDDDFIYSNTADGTKDDNAVDVLSGGVGADTFYVGDGDVIKDADGEDKAVYLNGTKLSGPMVNERGGGCDEDDDSDDEELGSNEFMGEDGALYKFASDPSGANDIEVTIELDGATITIQSWSEGDFGWRISEEQETDDSKCDAESIADPILIDLDGDGIEVQGLNVGVVYFDYEDTGFAQRTAWVTGDDGILVVDLNGDGEISNGSEIFGSSEVGLGFDGLEAFDSNFDGIVDARDERFEELLVWQDHKVDGISDADELFTLTDLGITSISLALSYDFVELEGGVTQTGAGEVTFIDGTTAEAVEVEFTANPHLTEYRGDTVVNAALSSLPYLNGYGTVLDLDLAMTEDAGLRGQVEVLAGLGVDDASQFSSLVEQLIYRWHRVEDVAEDARGDFIGGQRMEALEQLFGEEYLNDNVFGAGGSPRPVAGVILQNGWDNYHSNVSARLMAQSELGDILFPELGYYGRGILEVEEGTSVIDVISRMELNAPNGSDPYASVSYWKSMVLAISAVEAQFSESGVGFEGVVDGALGDAGIAFGYRELQFSQVAMEEGGILIGRAASSITGAARSSDLFVTGGGDDRIIDGGGYNTILFGEGSGHDVVEGASRGVAFHIRMTDLSEEDISVSLGGQDGRDLIITIVATGETLTFEDTLSVRHTSFLADISAEFSDGSMLDLSVPGAIPLQEATDGNDRLFGGPGDDDLAGGAGDDFLIGGGGSDTYRFGPGDGSDRIYDSGRDTDVDTVIISAALSELTATFDDGDFIFSLPDGSELTIENGVSIEQYQFTDQTVSGADFEVSLELASRTFLGDSGDNTLEGSFADEFLEGGLGNDLLIGGSGEDIYTYSRGDGADIIEDGGSTVIDHGVREDFDTLLIQGYSPAEVALSRIVDDNDDLVLTFADSGDSLTIRNQLEWAPEPEINDPNHSGITFVGSDEIERISFEDGTVWTVEDVRRMLTEQSTSDENDNILGFDRINDTLEGGLGNDMLQGGSGDDTYRLSRGHGSNIIIEQTGSGSAAGNDTVVLADFDPTSMLVTRDGADIVLTFDDAPTDSVRIRNQIFVDQIGTVIRSASPTVEAIIFEQAGVNFSARELLDVSYAQEQTIGNDSILGTAFAETILIGAGDDTVSGGRGNDVYLRDGQASGDDVIDDNGIISFDTLRLTNVDPSNVSVLVDGDSLVLQLPAGSVRLQNQRSNLDWDTIERVEFDDGISWNLAAISAVVTPIGGTENTVVGTPANETLSGTVDDDTIGGDAGADVLRGGNGNDLYIWGSGAGNDTIQERGGSSRFEVDRLQFSDLTADNIEVTRISETELTVTNLLTGELLTLDGQFGNSNNAVEYFIFSDGAEWDIATIRTSAWERGTNGADELQGFLSPIMFGGLGDDELKGGFRQDNTYIIRRDDGNDTIRDLGGIDTLRLEGVVREDITFEASTDNQFGDLIIRINGSDDAVLVSRQLLVDSDYGIERIVLDDGAVITDAEIAANSFVASTSGADTIRGTDASEQFRGGLGADDMDGARGSDTYFWSTGDGNDTLTDTGRYGEVDTLVLTDVLNQAGVSIAQGAGSDDLILTVLSSGEAIQVMDGSIEAIRFADGIELDIRNIFDTLPYIGTDEDDELSGTASDNLFIGGLGDDTIFGGNGADTYIYALGDGNDLIGDGGLSAGADTLRFMDIDQGDVSVSRDPLFSRDLIIEVLATGNTIRILGQFDSITSGIEEIEYGGGAIQSLTDITSELPIIGTSADDFLIGTVFDETLHGLEGDDVLEGAGGDDIYIWNSGDGFDTIFDNGRLSDQDTLNLSGFTQSEVSLLRGAWNTKTFELVDGVEPDSLESEFRTDDLIVLINATGEMIVVEGHFAAPQFIVQFGEEFGDVGEEDIGDTYISNQIETIVFADGSVSAEEISTALANGSGHLLGDHGDNTLDGGVGDDTLIGGQGDDTYIFDRAYGQDQVFDAGGDADVIRFGDGILPGFISPQRVGDDLLIEIGGTERLTLTIVGQFNSNNNSRVEQFEFADGLVLGWREIQDLLIAGQTTEGADFVSTFNTDDVVETRGGDDRIIASDGHDIYDGGEGVDTVEFRGRASWYNVEINEGVTTVTDRYDADNVYTLIGIERLAFTFDDEDSVLQPNTAPIAADFDLNVVEDSTVSVLLSDVVRAAQDVDGNALTVTSANLVGPGEASLSVSAIVIRPDADFNGSLVVDYTIEDAFGGSGTGQLNITVVAVNDAPEAINDLGFSTDEDVPFIIFASDLIANDRDVDGDSLGIVSVSSDDITVVLNGSGDIEVSPGADFAGNFSFTYVLSDGVGGTSEGLVGGEVIPINDDPDIDFIPDTLNGEGGVAIIVSPFALTDTGTDIEGDELTLERVERPVGGAVEIDESGLVVFTPENNFSGYASFDYVLGDGNGGFVTGTQSIVISAANAGPVFDVAANLGAFTEDTALVVSEFDLLAFVTDADDDILSVTNVWTSSSGIYVSDNGDRTWSITPDLDFYGTGLVIDFTVTDGTVTVAGSTLVDVSPVNDFPVASAILTDQIFAEDAAISFALPLDAFSDIDGDVLSLSASLLGGAALPSWLNFDPVQSSFSGQPPQDFHGAFDIEVTTSDGDFDASQTFSLEITPVNDAPVVTNDSGYTLEADSILTILSADVLANDIDPDGDVLTVSSVGGAVGGAVSLDMEGNIVFVADPDFAGAATFAYFVSDGSSTTEGSVELTIMPDSSNPWDDFLQGGSGSDLFFGRFGSENSYSGRGGNDYIYGSFRSDMFAGGEGDDYIFGRSGSDTLWGNEGNDRLTGGGGDDVLRGGGGNDRLFGGMGSDVLDGGSGNDTLRAGAGDDEVISGNGNDILEGGTGNDIYFWSGDSGSSVVIENAFSGHDRLVLSSITSSNLTFTQEGQDLVIENTSTNATLEIDRYFSVWSTRIEDIELQDSSVLTRSNVHNIISNGGAIIEDSALNGSLLADVNWGDVPFSWTGTDGYFDFLPSQTNIDGEWLISFATMLDAPDQLVNLDALRSLPKYSEPIKAEDMSDYVHTKVIGGFNSETDNAALIDLLQLSPVSEFDFERDDTGLLINGVDWDLA